MNIYKRHIISSIQSTWLVLILLSISLSLFGKIPLAKAKQPYTLTSGDYQEISKEYIDFLEGVPWYPTWGVAVCRLAKRAIQQAGIFGWVLDEIRVEEPIHHKNIKFRTFWWVATLHGKQNLHNLPRRNLEK